MPIGDVNSTERGSGARYNDGKVDLTLLPPQHWLSIGDRPLRLRHYEEMEYMAQFWEGKTGALYEVLGGLDPLELIDAARVLEYGAKKYAMWNWAKGMPWSVPMACYLRHMLTYGDVASLDEESGLPHRAHAVCNLIMLGHYAENCPDLDDRPEELRPEFHEKTPDWAADYGYGPELVQTTLKDILGVQNPELSWDEENYSLVYYTLDGHRVQTVVGNLPTALLNDLGEVVAEEQESRQRILLASGVIT